MTVADSDCNIVVVVLICTSLLLFSDVLFTPVDFFVVFTSSRNLQISCKMGPEGKRLLNIVILGFGFMFMFTAFQTCGNIEVG